MEQVRHESELRVASLQSPPTPFAAGPECGLSSGLLLLHSSYRTWAPWRKKSWRPSPSVALEMIILWGHQFRKVGMELERKCSGWTTPLWASFPYSLPWETPGAREGLYTGRCSTSLLGTHFSFESVQGRSLVCVSEKRHKVEFSWPMPISGQRENDQAYLRLLLESPENPLVWVRGINPALKTLLGMYKMSSQGPKP